MGIHVHVGEEGARSNKWHFSTEGGQGRERVGGEEKGKMHH